MSSISPASRSNTHVMLLVGAVVIGAIGSLFYNVMPLFLGSLQDSIAFTNAQIGLVASAFFLGFNVGSASSFFWVRKIPVRATSLAGTVVVLALLYLTTLAKSFALLEVVIVALGAVSGGLAVIGTTVIADAEDAAFWYGVKVAAESASGALLLFVLPASLIPQFGFSGTILGMGLLIGLSVPCLFFLSAGRVNPSANVSSSDPAASLEAPGNISRWAVWLPISTMTVLCVGGSAVWAFEERIAAQYGFDAAWVGGVLGTSLIFAVIGPIVSGYVANRVGLWLPYLFGIAAMVLGIFAIALSFNSAALYAFGACSFMMGWGIALPSVFAKIAELDPDGRHISLSIPALGVGTMIGPTVAGLLFIGSSVAPLQWASVAMLGISLVIFWSAGRNGVGTLRHA